jgi:hypothetical protein
MPGPGCSRDEGRNRSASCDGGPGFGSYFSMCLSPEAFRIPGTHVTSVWIEHTPFATWLMEALRPKCLVDLGRLHGVS